MLTREAFLSLNFVKKGGFHRELSGNAVYAASGGGGGGEKLQVYLWSEPFGFEATPDEKDFRFLPLARRDR